jgi:hypothetical protein
VSNKIHEFHQAENTFSRIIYQWGICLKTATTSGKKAGTKDQMSLTVSITHRVETYVTNMSVINGTQYVSTSQLKTIGKSITTRQT